MQYDEQLYLIVDQETILAVIICELYLETSYGLVIY